MACRSCDLKRIYRLFEEKARREAEKKAYIPVEAVVEPVVETTEEVKIEEPIVE